MMKIIFKYYLSNLMYISNGDYLPVFMPQGAKILNIGPDLNGQDSCIWALIDNEAVPEQRMFVIYGTGYAMDNVENLKHLATFSYITLVFHVFEVLK